jgi:signal transduction histidine kinase
VVSVVDLWVRADVDSRNVGNIFLLMIGGPLIGYTTGLLKQMAAARDRAERAAAAAAERQRLARVVHDGVLQVLALVQRRGAELGGEAADLGRLAGEQEVALRGLVQQFDAPVGAAGSDATVDLARSLSALAAPQVTISVPAGPVPWPAGDAEEVVAVVRACLDNVRVHVGRDAPAWVLVEDLGASVIVTVRDEGPGIPEGRLAEAAAEGRLGVRTSIKGRVADLGGTARLATAPGRGAEWEFTFPRPR